MIGFFSNLIFLNPWVLAGLAALPLLWLLLRITPPVPRVVLLPSARFLEGLFSAEKTPSKTPWWILLLRLIAAALIILALAHPVYKPADKIGGNGMVRLVISNGWSAASTWDQQMDSARQIVAEASRKNRNVLITTTALPPGQEDYAHSDVLSGTQAQNIIKTLKPYAWTPDFKALAQHLKTSAPDSSVYTLWLGDGLEHAGQNAVMNLLQAQGGLTYIAPGRESLPVILRPSAEAGYKMQIAVDAPPNTQNGRPVTVQALNESGRVLEQVEITLNAADLPQDIVFNMPESVRPEVTQYRLQEQGGAGGVFLLDARFRKRAVGIAGLEEDTQSKPFIDAGYYLKRALEPFTTLYQGGIESVLDKNPSVIILPDIGAMPVQTLDRLEQWVRGGGVLLRFAGPNMTQSAGENFLVPWKLRTGGRAMDGTMTWDTPLKLQNFPEHSPLAGLVIHEQVTVNRQILAEPGPGLDERTWATLEDGTPLVTAAPMDKGLLVMVHTTASPAWSDLALSGFFVEMLQRIINLSGHTQGIAEDAAGGVLQPLAVLDGFGVLQSPGGGTQPLSVSEFENAVPGPKTPPGIYGSESFQKTLNLGEKLPALKALGDLPLGVTKGAYGQSYEQDLLPLLLFAALSVVLLDWIIMIILSAGMPRLPRFAGIFIGLFATGLCFPALAQNYTPAMEYADGFHLAFIQSGDASTDMTARRGLENLNIVLTERTSIAPVGVAALNPETDDLAFFPLIYWPITDKQSTLSAEALIKIQNYLDHGGTILFDTRDENYRNGSFGNTRNGQILQQLTSTLNIPPLEPIPQNHVLTKSFYLLDSFPGRYASGTLWVEEAAAGGRDGVSSVIIGSQDWMSAWADGAMQRGGFAGSNRQQEMALRFGVNLVMYTLTGNYKADQVHVPYILERLGQ